MGFFSKKKDEKEQIQTADIKSATIPNNSSLEQNIPPTIGNVGQNNLTSNQQNTINNNNNNDFNNPFANQVPTEQNNLNQIPNNNQMNLNENSLNTNNNLNVEQPNISSNPVEENLNLNSQDNSSNLTNNMDEYQIQELIDETVEKLIEEKWDKIVSNVDSVLKWKEKQQQQMDLIKTDIVDMKENLEKIEQKILNKISSYDKNILDVNSEIKALEKVFQKITPTLVNNVNELANIADNLKGIKPYKQENSNSSSRVDLDE